MAYIITEEIDNVLEDGSVADRIIKDIWELSPDDEHDCKKSEEDGCITCDMQYGI